MPVKQRLEAEDMECPFLVKYVGGYLLHNCIVPTVIFAVLGSAGLWEEKEATKSFKVACGALLRGLVMRMKGPQTETRPS